MLKYYLTILSLGLTGFVLPIFYRQSSALIQLFSLAMVIFGSVTSTLEVKKYFADRISSKKTGQSAKSLNSSDLSDLLQAPDKAKADLMPAIIRLEYLLHLTNPGSQLKKKIQYALNCVCELLPEKTFVFYEYAEAQINFCCATRVNARNVSKSIPAIDPLIEEFSEKLHNLLDLRKLARNDFSATDLPFKRSVDESQCLILPVNFFGRIQGILAIISPGGEGLKRTDKSIINCLNQNLSLILANHKIYADQQNKFFQRAQQELTHKLYEESLPANSPVLKGWDFSWIHNPAAEPSGDFYDFLNLPGNSFMLIIGKASGRGINAAIFFTRLRAMVRCIIDQVRSPADLLNQLSKILGQDSKEDLFATIMALQIKTSDPEVKFANAGHASPIINRPRSGFAEIQDSEDGIPLGLFSSSPEPYINQTIHLLPGDGIFLYTDGITEPCKSRPERLSTENMKRTLESLPELSAAETLENFTGQLFFDNNLHSELAEDQTGIYLKLE